MTEKAKYKAIIKKYKKELKRQAKKAAPWDWEYMYESIRTYIEFMHDYYNQDYNVVQADESRNTIKKSLQECLDIYHRLDTLYDSLPECKLIMGEGGSIAFEYPDSSEEEYNRISVELVDKEQELYKQLFDTIKNNFQSWWD